VDLPSRLKARHACVAVPGAEAVVRVLTFPGRVDTELDGKVVESIGVEAPEEHRIGYKILTEGHGRTETRVLAVALPEADAAAGISLLPSSGLPAPYSVVLAGLATMSCFLHGPGARQPHETVGVVDFGGGTTLFTLIREGAPVLIRKFDRGTDTVLARVRKTLSVDGETAEGIISDGSFDISQTVAEVLDPLLRQFVVSRDFIERREDCHLQGMYVAGGLAASRDALNAVKTSMGVDVAAWNPFEDLAVSPQAVPEGLAGREWRFTAAVGAVLGTFEET
jgi:Tfp pilus assembly PilM family ATPase